MATRAPKVVRNMTAVPLNLRLGSQRDPYFVALQRRGNQGDAHVLSADLAEHERIHQNVKAGVLELITMAEYNKIEYARDYAGRPQRPTVRNEKGEPIQFAGVERESEHSTVVGTYDANDRSGNVTRVLQPVADGSAPAHAALPGTEDSPEFQQGVVKRRKA